MTVIDVCLRNFESAVVSVERNADLCLGGNPPSPVPYFWQQKQSPKNQVVKSGHIQLPKWGETVVRLLASSVLATDGTKTRNGLGNGSKNGS